VKPGGTEIQVSPHPKRGFLVDPRGGDGGGGGYFTPHGLKGEKLVHTKLRRGEALKITTGPGRKAPALSAKTRDPGRVWWKRAVREKNVGHRKSCRNDWGASENTVG